MKILHRLITLITLALPLAANAMDTPLPPTHQGYWGVGYNMTKFSTNRNGVLTTFNTLSPATSVDGATSNLAAFAGWRFDELLAAQMDMFTGGSVRATDAGVQKKLFEVSLLTISAVANHKLSDQLNLYGKLGGTFFMLSQPLTSNASLTVDNGFGPSFGVGLDYNLYGGSERMLRLEWNYYRMDNVLLSNANGLTLSALFQF